MIPTGATFRLFNTPVRVLGRVNNDQPMKRRQFKVRLLGDTKLRGMVICEGAEMFVSSDWCHNAARKAGIQTRLKYSQHEGVTYHKTRRTWYAFNYENGRRVHIGCFIDEDLAFRARKRYLAKKQEAAA